MQLNLERVIRFCVVAEEMSVTGAAKRLNVDQAWLSRQVQQLEEQLGFRLFERTTRRITLTHEGATFYEAAAEMSQVTDRVKAVARAIYDQRHDQIRIGVSPSSFWLPERHTLFSGFRSQYPRFQVDIRTAFTPHLIGTLESRKLDLAVTTPFEERPALEYTPIHRSSPGLLVPVESPLANNPTIRASDLKGLVLAVPTQKENPLAYKNQYQPFLDAGMKARIVPEGRLAIFHYAINERILMLGFQAESESLTGNTMRYRDVIDIRALSEFGVARLRGDDRVGVRRLWAAAQALTEKVPAAWMP